jgi:hypothetical protein
VQLPLLYLKHGFWLLVNCSVISKSARELSMADESTGDLIIKRGKLAVERKVQQKFIYNINLWTSAFIIFTSIMIENHPGKAQELLKYPRDIRQAAYRAPAALAWVQNDEQFRLKKSRNPSSSWGVIDNELWLICIFPLLIIKSPVDSSAMLNSLADFNKRDKSINLPSQMCSLSFCGI